MLNVVGAPFLYAVSSFDKIRRLDAKKGMEETQDEPYDDEKGDDEPYDLTYHSVLEADVIPTVRTRIKPATFCIYYVGRV